ncbi:AzlD domain-containing protein [Furfurilactobacillus curtus]|uniref:Branched-chain amino acid transporter n=1 Tax=Furfurilactobacillus curtus TaxID=1746200 RepID=A0ABQ5JPF1_9LACO
MNDLVLVLCAGVAAFIPRYFPMLFFSKRKIPAWFNEWMGFVPVSLFTALIVKQIFVTSTYAFSMGNIAAMISAVIVILIAYFTRSMTLSVVLGLLIMWALTLFL